jgi:hypothetical protein
MGFIGLLAKLQGLLAQQGVVIQWEPLLKQLWREELGEEGVEQIITRINPTTSMPTTPEEDLTPFLGALMGGEGLV